MTPRRRTALAVGALALLGLVAWWCASSGAPAPEQLRASRAVGPARSPPAARSTAEEEPFVRWRVDSRDAGGPTTGGLVAAPPNDAGLSLEGLERLGRHLLVAQWLRANADAAERSVDAYCAESRNLVAAHAFGNLGTRADAATYLAVRVDWEDGRVGLLHLPDALMTRVRALPPGTWPQALDENDWQGLDFSWLEELSAFDHWTLSADGPLKDPPSLSFETAPLPNYLSLMAWARLRLAKGLREGQLELASRQVRHLADLIGTSGVMVSEMIRVTLMRYDRTAWEASGLSIPPTSTMTLELSESVRRVGLASPYFLFPGVPREVQRKALACGPVRCAQLLEALGAAVMLEDFVPDTDAQFSWLMEQQPCDRVFAQKLRTGPPPSLETLEAMFTSGPGADRFGAFDAGL